MPGPHPSERLQVVGVDPLAPPRRTPGGPVVVVVALAVTIFLLGSFPYDGGETPVADNTAQLLESPAAHSKLLHPIGGPVDVVERFMTSISYRQPEVAAHALASNATTVELPFLSTVPEGLAGELAIYRDTRAVIALHGCDTVDSAAEGTPVRVRCPITFYSNFVRDLEAQRLRGVLSFLVDDGLILTMSVAELESPVDGASDLDAIFDQWLVDFYSGPT